MQLIKIRIGDITVGDTLPWAVLDQGGTLLLNKGYVIPNERQLSTIIQSGYFKDEATTAKETSLRNVHPFVRLKEIQIRLSRVLTRMEEGDTQGEVVLTLDGLVSEVSYLCQKAPDVMIGTLHLFNDKPYSITHLLHMAVLTGLLVDDLGLDASASKNLIGAALTCNVSMMKLQELLEQQTSPLSQEQRARIQNHPQQSVDILHAFGIESEDWLNSVAQHHEAIDGSGYPHGISGENIYVGAKILAIADNYSSLTTKKNYRKGHTSSTVLRHFFQVKGKILDEALCLRLIKILGIYPPGTFVKLVSGESAIVTKRSATESSIWPQVSVYRSAKGPFLADLVIRDTAQDKFKISEVITYENQPYEFDTLWEVVI